MLEGPSVRMRPEPTNRDILLEGSGPPGEAFEGGQGDSERARGLVKASSGAWVHDRGHRGLDRREWERGGSRNRRERRGSGKGRMTCM